MNIFVAKIHNNSLGSCISIESYEEGKVLIRKMAEEQFQRPLTESELAVAKRKNRMAIQRRLRIHRIRQSIEDEMELYNDDDADNVYTFSIGAAE
jgi:hypothetical protein